MNITQAVPGGHGLIVIVLSGAALGRQHLLAAAAPEPVVDEDDPHSLFQLLPSVGATVTLRPRFMASARAAVSDDNSVFALDVSCAAAARWKPAASAMTTTISEIVTISSTSVKRRPGRAPGPARRARCAAA